VTTGLDTWPFYVRYLALGGIWDPGKILQGCSRDAPGILDQSLLRVSSEWKRYWQRGFSLENISKVTTPSSWIMRGQVQASWNKDASSNVISHGKSTHVSSVFTQLLPYSENCFFVRFSLLSSFQNLRRVLCTWGTATWKHTMKKKNPDLQN